MTHYDYTKSRTLQWIGIILIIGLFAGAYWYFKVRASTLNAPQNDSLTAGLVGMWSFNGDDISGTTAYDRSGNGNNGTLTNGPVVTDGKVGQGISFDGSNDTVATADSALYTQSALTVSFWKKDVNTSLQRAFVTKSQSGDRSWAIEGGGSTGDAAVKFTVSDSIATSSNYGVTPDVMTPGNWYHVVGVFNGAGTGNAGRLQIYVNGVLQPLTFTGTIPATSINNGTGIIFGQGGSTSFFLGTLDEARVYNRALSASEVQSLYTQGGGTKVDSSISQNQGTGRLDSGLTSYYKLDDGSGTTPVDSSSRGNNGTFSGSPTWITGKIGGALNFTGSEAVTLGALSLDKGTISAWVAPDNAQFGANGNFEVIGASWSGGNFDLYHYLHNGAGSLESITASIRGSFGSTLQCFSIDGATVVSTAWRHYTITYDVNSGCTMYLDGVAGSFAAGTTGSLGSRAYAIAGPGALSSWKGKIDEVRIYDRVLSSDEVQQLYSLTSPTGVDSSLMGYWSFNGKDLSGTTAYDRSGSGNTGTLTNGPTSINGQVGQGLSFDGADDYVNVPDSVALSPTTTLSYSFWAKRTDTVASNRAFLAKSDGGGGRRSTAVTSLSGGGIRFHTATGSNTDAYWDTVATGLVQQNQWVYITAVFNGPGATDADRAKVYVNGAEQALSFGSTVPSSVPDVVTPLTIGGNTTYSYFPGALDEVRVYSRVLSVTEIKSLYEAGVSDKVNSSVSQNQGTGRLDSGLAGYWPLDNGSGTSATDLSTNGNTGTLTNGPTWGTGQIGGDVVFDGTNDYISYANTIPLDANDFTVAGWVKLNGAGGGLDGKNYLFSQRIGTTGTGQPAVNIYFDTSYKPQITIRDNVGNAVTASAPTAISLSAWHYIVGIKTSSSMYLYVDGALVQTTSHSLSGDFDTGVNVRRIGSTLYDVTTEAFLNGAIDDVRLYNRALAADEVSQLYRLTSPTGTDTSLKGYWSFNGKDLSGTTAYDRSGSGKNGTLTSGPVPINGKIGQGLSFDGVDDYVTTANATTTYQFPDTTFSVSGWFKKSGSSSGNVVAQGACYGGWTVSVSSGTVNAILRQSGSCGGAAAQRSSSTTTLNDGAWHHFVVIFTTNTSSSAGNDASIYIDGALNQGSVSRAGSPYGVTAVDLYVGVSNGAGGNFAGSIDEIRIYNRALSAAEIVSLYNSSR